MSLSKTIGIYAIKNKVNDRFYIGQSANVRRRISQHFSALRGGYHCNTALQQDWDTYGEDKFESLLLEECSQEELESKEMYYIEKYHSFTNGYNKTRGGIGPHGQIFSAETHQRMRDSHHDYRRANHPQAIKIALLNTNETFDCIKDASEKYHVASSDIIRNARGETYYAGRYGNLRLAWRFYDDYIQMSDSEIQSVLHRAANGRKGANCHTARSVKCINTGIVFQTIQSAAEYYQIGKEAVSATCHHTQAYGGIDPETKEKLKWEFC